MDGETSEVASNPAAVELFGDGGGGAGAAEAIENEVAFGSKKRSGCAQEELQVFECHIQRIRWH